MTAQSINTTEQKGDVCVCVRVWVNQFVKENKACCPGYTQTGRPPDSGTDVLKKVHVLLSLWLFIAVLEKRLGRYTVFQNNIFFAWVGVCDAIA